MFCATGTQQCYTKASKGDLLPGQGGFAAKGKPGEALPPCAVIRAAVRVKLLCFPFAHCTAWQVLCGSSGGAFNGELWGLLLIKSLGTSHFCPAGAACGNGASAAQGICVGESSVRFFYCKKRAAVRQNCLIQQLFFCVVIPALPAAPARSRCSGICRWSSAQRSGRTLPQWRRCSGGSCTARCSPDAWEAWVFPCARPCRFQ